MTGEGDFFYPLLIVIGKMLHHTAFILTAREPPEPVIVQLQAVEAQQQVVPYRVAVLFGAVTCRVPEEAFFLLRFNGLCDLACGIVSPTGTGCISRPASRAWCRCVSAGLSGRCGPSGSDTQKQVTAAFPQVP